MDLLERVQTVLSMDWDGVGGKEREHRENQFNLYSLILPTPSILATSSSGKLSMRIDALFNVMGNLMSRDYSYAGSFLHFFR